MPAGEISILSIFIPLACLTRKKMSCTEVLNVVDGVANSVQHKHM
jgi:hypothetical protein